LAVAIRDSEARQIVIKLRLPTPIVPLRLQAFAASPAARYGAYVIRLHTAKSALS